MLMIVSDARALAEASEMENLTYVCPICHRHVLFEDVADPRLEQPGAPLVADKLYCPHCEMLVEPELRSAATESERAPDGMPVQKNREHFREGGGQMPSEPTREQIEKRAYEHFLARGCEHGRDVEDWLAAEQELQVSEIEEPREGSATAVSIQAVNPLVARRGASSS